MSLYCNIYKTIQNVKVIKDSLSHWELIRMIIKNYVFDFFLLRGVRPVSEYYNLQFHNENISRDYFLVVLLLIQAAK